MASRQRNDAIAVACEAHRKAGYAEAMAEVKAALMAEYDDVVPPTSLDDFIHFFCMRLGIELEDE